MNKTKSDKECKTTEMIKWISFSYEVHHHQAVNDGKTMWTDKNKWKPGQL